MDSKSIGSASESFLLDAWEKHEKIAMHFNDLILKIRIQALGTLAAIVTVGGVLLKSVPPETHAPWGVISSVFFVLLAFWIAIFQLDFLYYNRLLMGAVDCLLVLEEALNDGKRIEFNMSHKIEASVLGKAPTRRQMHALRGPLFFYLIVTTVLLVALLYSGARFFCSRG